MTNDQLQQWKSEGYLTAPGLLTPKETINLRTICEDILDQWKKNNPSAEENGNIGDATVMRHLNDPMYFQEHPEWKNVILETAAHPKVLSIVERILEEKPLFRCTSLFFNPSKMHKDGNWHRDTQFQIKDIEEEKKAVLAGKHTGVQLQIALVPSEDSEIVPGSHLRWDTPEEFHIRRADNNKNWNSNTMPGALRVSLQPGDAVIFNPMGLHRGRYHNDKLRRTIMLTYTSKSKPKFDYFSNQPYFLNENYLNGLSDHAKKFYEDFLNVYKENLKEKEATAA